MENIFPEVLEESRMIFFLNFMDGGLEDYRALQFSNLATTIYFFSSLSSFQSGYFSPRRDCPR